MPDMGIGSILSVAGPIVGGMMQGDAAGEAASTQAGAADRAAALQAESTRLSLEEQRRQYDLSRGDLAPYRNAGAYGLNTIRSLIGPGGQYAQDVPFQGPGEMPADAALPTFNYPGTRMGGNTLGGLVRNSESGGVDPRTAMFSGGSNNELRPSSMIAQGEPIQYGPGGRGGDGAQGGRIGGVDPQGGRYYPAISSDMPVELQQELQGGLTAERMQQLFPQQTQTGGTATVDQQGNVVGEAAPGVERFNAPEFDFNFEADPGYQFRMGEGVNAIQNSAAGRTGILSGNTLRGITEYGQNLASDEYGKAYGRARGEFTEDYGNSWDRYLNQLDLERQRYTRAGDEERQRYGRAVDQFGRDLTLSNTQQGRNAQRYGQRYAESTDAYNRAVGQRGNRLNTLQSLAGVGQQAVNTGTSLGANYANNVGNTMMTNAANIGNIGMNAANVQGAANIAGGNAMAGGLNNVSNYFTQQNTLNRLLSNQNRGGSQFAGYDRTNDPWGGP